MRERTGREVIVVTESFPKKIVIESQDLIEIFVEHLRPRVLPDEDIREILNQIYDVMLMDQAEAVKKFHQLPKDVEHRMLSYRLFDSIEARHVLKAATTELAWGLHARLREQGAFNSQKYPGEFPYIFEGLVGYDSLLFHIPY
jgi:hypothetical protein